MTDAAAVKLSDSARAALAQVAAWLSEGFTGTIEFNCHDGGVKQVTQSRVLKADELRKGLAPG